MRSLISNVDSDQISKILVSPKILWFITKSKEVWRNFWTIEPSDKATAYKTKGWWEGSPFPRGRTLMFLPTFANDHRTAGTWYTSLKARRLLRSGSCCHHCHLGRNGQQTRQIMNKCWLMVAVHLRLCFKPPGMLRLSYRKEEDAPRHEKVVVGQTDFLTRQGTGSCGVQLAQKLWILTSWCNVEHAV